MSWEQVVRRVLKVPFYPTVFRIAQNVSRKYVGGDNFICKHIHIHKEQYHFL